MGFGCYPHKESCDILSEDFVSRRLQANFSKKEGNVLSYTNMVKYRHGIRIPTACGYHICGGKNGFNVKYMFAQSYFALPVIHSILHHFLLGILANFTCLTILDGCIIKIKSMTMINISV